MKRMQQQIQMLTESQKEILECFKISREAIVDVPKNN